MRAYRTSYSAEGSPRGLTQEGLLERMGSVDSEYAERYSHATVSRWESGGTRPTVQRLKVFGKALELSQTDVAGLILLAGLAPDFQTALSLVSGSDRAEATGIGAKRSGVSVPTVLSAPADRSVLSIAVRFWLFRVLPLGAFIAAAYAFSLIGWQITWMPAAYVAIVIAIVLAQGLLLPDRDAPLREFFWVSLFFLLTTPLLQFSPIGMDHYGFYRIGDAAGTHLPFMLALLFNLFIAAAAGLMFHVQWMRQYSGDNGRGSALQRAVWVVMPPVVLVYAVVAVLTNISVSIQLAVLLPAVGAMFIALVVLRDSDFSPSGRDRLYLLTAASAVALVATTVGTIVVVLIYLSPDFPTVLPDHNLLRSWVIDFSELGFSREEALDRLNLGYMRHAILALVYLSLVVGGSVIAGIYRIGGDRRR